MLVLEPKWQPFVIQNEMLRYALHCNCANSFMAAIVAKEQIQLTSSLYYNMITV